MNSSVALALRAGLLDLMVQECSARKLSGSHPLEFYWRAVARRTRMLMGRSRFLLFVVLLALLGGGFWWLKATHMLPDFLTKAIDRLQQTAASGPKADAPPDSPLGPAPTADGTPTPEDVAKAMVTTFKENRGLGERPALNAYAKLDEPSKKALVAASKQALDIALTKTGEAPSNVEKFFLMTAADGHYLVRQFRDANFVGMINARLAKIDLPTIKPFQEAGKSDSPTLTCLAIAFQDYFFDGANWKQGNPEMALARLRSIPPEAITRWEAVIDDNNTWAAFALVGVDALFSNNQFQTKAFDEALPIAAELLKAK